MLAGDDVAAQVVTSLKGRGMVFRLETTEVGQEIANKYLQKGLEQGLERGLVRSMTLLLKARHGDFDGVEELAAALVADDYEANLAKVVNGAALEDLRRS
ncbi:hypothetical protein [Actinoplanes sp. NPDC051851]|uniref:hypothetical protein n=1 Tax=Actinoplanes sp. NPDC051851 TaxID=3154753 RepID=UPI0034495012